MEPVSNALVEVGRNVFDGSDWDQAMSKSKTEWLAKGYIMNNVSILCIECTVCIRRYGSVERRQFFDRLETDNTVQEFRARSSMREDARRGA